MEEKEISLNFNFLFFFPSSSCFCSLQFCFYIMCAPSFLLQTLLHMHIYTHTHTIFHKHTHTQTSYTHRHIHTQTNTFHVNSRHEQHSLLHSFAAHSLSLSVFYTLSFALSALTPKNIVCCVLHQLPFCLIFNFSVRLNLHAWLLYVKSRTGALWNVS